MKKILLMLFFAPLLLASDCDPDNPQPPDDEEPTTEELVKRSWKVKQVFRNDVAMDIANYSFDFKEDNTFSISAPDVEDPEFPSSGNWELVSNDQKMSLNDGAVEMGVVISETEFSLTHTYQNFKNGEVEFRFVLEPAN